MCSAGLANVGQTFLSAVAVNDATSAIDRGRQQCLIPAGVRWVLFDAVGTLIFPQPPVADAYFAAAARFGSRLSAAEIQERFALALERNFAGGCTTSEANERSRWQSIVREVIADIPRDIEAAFEQLWRHFADARHWRLYDDAASTLSALQRRGFLLGIASNFDGRLKNIVAGHAALSACEGIFISSDIGYSKPDARFFRGVQERLGVEPAEIALVGDDEACDFQAAIAAGWRAIHLDRSGQRQSAIRSLAELL
jgi:putative hydrolase of the HAD superfamily